MWKHTRLSLVLVGATLVCFLAGVQGVDQNKQQGPRWRWPDENPSRVGAGRLIPVGRPPVQQLQLQPAINPAVPVANQPPKTRPLPAAAATPQTAAIVASLPPVPAKEPAKTTDEPGDIDPPGSSSKNASAVPLLKDAGKPGNPYILLNDIFPPQNSIRTKEQEEASFNSLQNKDLGGLDPKEVYLADDDLFVVRGFNYKKPYTADPPGPPISDYQAPAPLPPPPPEPGTVFYPANETEENFNFFNPDFNSTNPADLPFFPFIPGGLNENNQQPPNFHGGDPNFLPFPFLPPPPPHWTEEKEFNNNDIRDPFQSGGNFPFTPPGQGFALFNGTQGPPPPSGLNGFPGIPPQFQPGSPQAGPGLQQRPPSGFPPAGPGGFPPTGPGGLPFGGPNGFPPGAFPPNGPPTGGPPSGNPGGNVTVFDEDEDIPFTPLFPERPVEYYYPTHNTTAQPPGPFGPGIFVPPPLQFFSPRNKSEVINVVIPPKLFQHPFNLPNYYQKESPASARPYAPRPQYVNPQGQQQPFSQFDGFYNANQQVQKVPEYKPIPSRPSINPIYPVQPAQSNDQGTPVLPPNVQIVPTKGTILLDTQFKEVSKLELPQQLPFGYSFQQGNPQQQHRPTDPNAFGPGAQHPIKLSSPVAGQSNYNLNGQPYPQYSPYYTAHGAPGISLESDINVNFNHPRPAINPDSEIIDPTRFPSLNPNWNPYTVAYAQQVQPQKYESLNQPIVQQTTETTSTSKPPPANFVAVYRIGGGSYSYNLNRGR